MKLSRKLLVLGMLLLFAGTSCAFFNKIAQSLTDDPFSKETPLPTLDFSPRRDLVFKPDTLPDAQIGIPYEIQINVEETETPVGDFLMGEGELPPGLILEKIDGENSAKISGTPQKTGVYKFLLKVWCYGTNKSGQTGEVRYTIDVKE